jgi:hypothetical protein
MPAKDFLSDWLLLLLLPPVQPLHPENKRLAFCGQDSLEVVSSTTPGRVYGALSSPLRIEDAATATALKELQNRSCRKFKTGEPINISPKQHREL